MSRRCILCEAIEFDDEFFEIPMPIVGKGKPAKLVVCERCDNKFSDAEIVGMVVRNVKKGKKYVNRARQV